MLSRMCYVIYHRGSQFIKKIEKLNIDRVYTSKKMNYTVVYADLNYERELKRLLRKIRGYKYITQSKIFNTDLNSLDSQVI